MLGQQSTQHPFTSHSRNRIDNTESYQKSGQKYYTSYEPRMALSSSPPPSSSPPMTPYSTRHARGDALIRSSPEIGLDTLFHTVREHLDDPSSARYLSNRYPERAFTPLKRDYFPTHSTSDFDVSEYSEDVEHDILEVDSEHTSDSAPGRNSVFFSDTEEEGYGKDDGFSFGHSGYRTTFFRTSAERGQWKSHPMPFKSTPLPQARSSVSFPLRSPTPVLVDSTRTISEPAPSTFTGLGFSVEPDQCDNLCAVDALPASSEDVAESELQHEAESPHTMPSLTSDWESMPDIDDDGHRYDRPSSPLPPSSPMSYMASRSVSLASSPLMRSSSPLSEISSLDEEERYADEMNSVDIGYPDIDIKIPSSVSAPTSDLDADIESRNAPDNKLATIIDTTASLKPDPEPSDFQFPEPFNDPSFSSAVTVPSPDHGTKHPPSIACDTADITSEASDVISPSPDSSVTNHLTDSMENQSQPTGIAQLMRRKPAQETEDSITQVKVEDDSSKMHAARRKRRKGNDHEDEHPMLKKHKVGGKVADLLQPTTRDTVRNGKKGTQVDKDKKSAKKQGSKKHGTSQVEVSISCPASSTKRGKPHRPLPKASSSRSHLTNLDRNVNNDRQPPPSAQDPATAALNVEICGMLIETMALSRASSLPLSSLYKMVMQTQPSLISQRSEQEWLAVFARVLQEGEAGHGSGVFGKVESSGKDDSNRPLEAQWFYVPEQDHDQERAALIRSMMPRPAKRTETKKYKQYYWRPLDKISKWDPEDEL